ncbi:MAG: anti-sigma factor [Actinoplanes sp.]
MSTDIHTLIGAYALDAVDDLERAAFERHLRDCDTCRAESDELRETTARLADAAWSVPPPRLRQDVLTRVAQTRQLPPAAPVAKPQRSTGRWRLMTAGAAVVVAAAGAGTAVYAVQEQRVREVRVVAEAARANEARVRAVLAAPDLVVHEEEVTGGGRVTVASSRLRAAGVIMLAPAAAPAGGRVYQLWTIRPGVAPVSAGDALDPGQTAALRLVDGLPGATDVGVTVEPPNGSATPTLPLVADVKLA